MVWSRIWLITEVDSTGVFFKPAIPTSQDSAESGQSLSRLELLLQFADLALELGQDGILDPAWASRTAAAKTLEHRLEGTAFPPVVGLARQAQEFRPGRSTQLAGPNLEDDLNFVARRVGERGHLVGLLLHRFQALLEPGRREGGRAQKRLQPRTQNLPLAEVGSALQCLDDPLHGSLLPLMEGDPVDPQLAAYFRRFAPVGPHRQHRLGFLQGGEVTRGFAGLAGLFRRRLG